MMSELPKTYSKLVVEKFSTNIREAVSVMEVDMCQPENDEVCIKNSYVGLNADDINLASGRYFVDKVPCDIGFEGIGQIVSIGRDVNQLCVGDNAVYFASKYNAYAEYVCVRAIDVFKVPEIKPEYLALVVCGLTGCIGLDQVGHIKEGDTVLITAAAGGVGHIALQWAKLAKCHVIGTCSTDEKVSALKQLGCDRVINYSKEDLTKVLNEEYPNGVDVVWETIGGKVLETCLQHLATRGRVIVAGGISNYKGELAESRSSKIDLPALSELIFWCSKSVCGYNMENYTEFYMSYFSDLLRYFDRGQIQVLCNAGTPEFKDFEGIINGIEYLYRGKSIGKLLAKIR